MAIRHPVLLLLIALPYLASGCSRGLHATSVVNPLGKLNADDPQTCQACLWGIRLLDDSLCDDGVNEFVAKFVIDKVCGIAKDKSQLCGNAGVCGKQIMSFPEYTKARTLPVGGVVECQFCKVVVERVKLALDNPASQERVKEEAIKVCKAMEPALQESCITFVTTNEVAFFTFIDTMLPGQVCEMAGACFPQLVKNHPLPALSAPLAHSLGNILNAPKVAGADNNMCDTCKMIVLEAHQMVTNPKTQRQIEDFVEQVCSSFGTAKDECSALMEEYLPLVLEVLAEYLDGDQLCQQIGYCHKAHGLQRLFSALRLRNLPLAQAKFPVF